tara:strand:+ start:658 stop:2373 length:1716 start_codon:yes stop_codon:yes gene_type:complete
MNEEIFDIKKNLDFAISCIQNNKYSEAIKIYEKILQENKDIFDANSNLGMLYAQQNNLEKAEKYLNDAIKIDSNNPFALNNLASILIRLGKYDVSIEYSQKAINIKQDFSLAYNNLGLAQQNLKKNDDAIRSFSKAIEKEKSNVLPYYNLAILYENLNDIKNSEKYYLKAIETNPKYFSAYNNIMNLYERTNEDSKLKLIIESAEKEFSDNFLIKLFKGKLQFKSKLYSDAISNLESFKFEKNNYIKEVLRCHTLANSYDEINKFDKAFEYFELSNSINLKINKNIVNRYAAIEVIEKRINFFNEKNLKDWKSINIENNKKNPIFIIGFPRSGTTLLDTILRSHPKVDVIEEKPIVNNFIELLNEQINFNFSNLKDLDQKLSEKMRIKYFDILSNYTKLENQKIYIDKMPLNIIYVGEIVRIFPDAKFILAIRHPCDCILSCFMQSFSLNDSMANFTDLKSTSNFYNQVMILWQQYLRVLKVKYHLIRYEDLVSNFDISVNQLLNFLDLEWSDSINKFYDLPKDRGKISTPSYNQVNKPIYSKSVGRWKNYENKFKEIYPIIEPWIKKFNY